LKETVDELTPGTLLAERYEIEGPISSGAMGAVYRATDREGDVKVAVKRLLDLRHAARFEIEARLLSQLRHPRVVEVLDHFQDESGQYLVMELVEGTDLGQIVKRRGDPGLPADEAVQHTLEACEALQYVHEQLIIHRDIKPANLIFGASGVVVVDFGIAREIGDDDGSDPGTIGVGTPRFMAPEILAGGAVSPRADVYGLAATLWNLLTGDAPAYDDTTKLSESVPGVTPELEAAVRAGLEFVPERRLTSIQAFAQALGARIEDGRGESLARSVEKPTAPEDLIERIVYTAAGVFDAAV
jgi:serine/threonine protein kinase